MDYCPRKLPAPPHPLLSSVNPTEGPRGLHTPQPSQRPQDIGQARPTCRLSAAPRPRRIQAQGSGDLTIHRDLTEAVNAVHTRASGKSYQTGWTEMQLHEPES